MSAMSLPAAESNGSPRLRLLSDLATAVRALGGHALLSLAVEGYPVLYVRQGERTVPVVAAQGPADTWWFVWGRASLVRADRVRAAAEHLIWSPSPAPPVTPREAGHRPRLRSAPLPAAPAAAAPTAAAFTRSATWKAAA